MSTVDNDSYFWHHWGEKKVKASVVIAEKTVDKVGDLIISAPIGVDIDKNTGELTAPVRIEALEKPVLKPKILCDLLINQGFLKARLIVEDNDPEPCPDVRKGIIKTVIIPIQSVIDIKGIRPSDHVQEHVKIRSLSVFAIPDLGPNGVVGKKIKLILKVILKVKIVVSREEIICVPVKKGICRDHQEHKDRKDYYDFEDEDED